MKLKNLTQSLLALALCCAAAFGQTVTANLAGTVVDPADAVIANVPVTLTSNDTGATRTATTESNGNFRFSAIQPGAYSITVKAPGFKTLVQKQINVDAQSTRDLGHVALQIGAVTDQVSVTAEAPAIQLTSMEKSATITSDQLENVALKGRDLFGYAALIPGVIDTNGTRNASDPGAIGGIIINGNISAKNFTVDGISDMDTGSNGSVHYEPNLDSIQELKVLTSNYQAEFGRNSGGTITVVTKNGTQEFHGSGNWNHRHEQFDANSWSNNRNGIQRPQYRYNIATYTIGGPVYIPKVFNKDKKRLFFFLSQEWTRQFLNGGSQTKYTPTALERVGDFSQTLQNNGALAIIQDPLLIQQGLTCSTTNAAGCFAGNKIPVQRRDPTGVGPAMLNFFPLPNTAGTGTQANIVNFKETAGNTHPRRNDVLRIDLYPTSKINGFVRYINDYDSFPQIYQGVQFTDGTGGVLGKAGPSPIDHPNPGHGWAGSFTYTITPTLINEFTYGKSFNTWSFYTLDDYKTEDRSLVNNPPLLFPIPKNDAAKALIGVNGYHNLMPQFQFGNVQTNASAMSYSRNNTSAGAYENFNDIWSVQDNLNKVAGKHTFKTGVYIEYNTKLQPAGQAYAGNYNFSPDGANPNNTLNGFANAYTGNFNTFQQATARTVFDAKYWNAEFFVQDNWRITKRLTLDLGVRFYHQSPQVDSSLTFVNWDPTRYSAAKAPRLYAPACKAGSATTAGPGTCATANRVSKDPLTNALAPLAYLGQYVPNSGDPANGFFITGTPGNPDSLYTQRYMVAAPRIGFAYDLFGNGKTSLKGGFGVFYNRLDGNTVYNQSGLQPLVYSPTVYYSSISDIAAGSSVQQIFGPNSFNAWPSTPMPWDGVRNASLDIQRTIGRSITVDIGYTGNWAYNQYGQQSSNAYRNLNVIPVGSRYPYTQSNVNPTVGACTSLPCPSGTSLQSNSLSDQFLRTKYPGLGAINIHNTDYLSNYNALTATANRRLSRGLAFGVSYTYSKALSVNSFNSIVADNRAYNYGISSQDRRQNLQINYNYDLPNLAKKAGIKFLGVITDEWSLSGITSYQSGSPYNPSVNFQNGTIPDATGTPDISARLNVVGDPNANVPDGLAYNPLAFQPATGLFNTNTATGAYLTPVFGNLGGGAGVLSNPGTTNFDATIQKLFKIKGLGERRGLKLKLEAYNVFNHTEYNGLGTQTTYDPTVGYTNVNTQTGTKTGARSNNGQSRIMAITMRFDF